jgi:exonuclease III
MSAPSSPPISHPFAASPAAISPPAPPLRLGSFNVGLSFVRKLPSILARCSQLALDAVALQEIGDPALLSNRFNPYLLAYAAGPSVHQAGVGLLLSMSLAPRIRDYKRSATGRLVGAVLQLDAGQHMLLVSAYMPSGLDHVAAGSDRLELARKLYAELLQWSAGMQQVVVMGDLNETLTPLDRLPRPPPRLAVAAASSPIHALVAEGFTDAWRHMHPSAEKQPGFTHQRDTPRPSRSRIDYIWFKGFHAAALQRACIDTSLRSLSQHHLLWVQLQPPRAAPPCTTPLLQLRLPNLRAACKELKEEFVEKLERELEKLQLLDDSADDHSADRLSSRAAALTQLVHRCAFVIFPLTGAAPFQSGNVLQLQQQRTSLTRVLRVAEDIVSSAATVRLAGDCLTHSPEWRRLWRQCRQHGVQWHCDAWYGGDPCAWVAETRAMLASTRRAIRKEQQRMQRHAREPLDVSPAAAVQRMLKSDALPSHLLSVVNQHGELTSSAEDLEAVMVDHFTSVFAMPPADPAPLDPAPPPMLFDKESVQREWYEGLMAPMREQELIEAMADAHLVSSPGEDQVSTGLWKIALHGSEALLSLVARLFSDCLHTSCFPSCWKTSVIVPLIKNDKKERTMSNVRPISLQSCLGKLFMKVLAHRLGRIFAQFPILNVAQRGFVHGGCIHKCIDELLDAWDCSRQRKSELYTLFYDIKEAYDSVQRDKLTRAMRRLRMPEAFIDVIADSLTGLSSRVRTAYGMSAPFDVQRSLRQGCPLAPLLFVVLMDALHDGLERNPFTGEQHGLVLRLPDGASESLPSLGYADDTNALTNTLAALRTQNDWVHYFMRFNSLRLNHAKCELVGRGPDGSPLSAGAAAAAGILVEGQPLAPVAHNAPIRYLGVQCRFDGSSDAQRDKIRGAIGLVTRVINKFSVSMERASYIFNVFLLPTIELGLRYVHGQGSTQFLKDCDRLLVGCIKYAVGSSVRLSHSAVALALRFTLPSWLETAVKVSELFIRMNSVQCRWGRLGRALYRQSLPSVLDDTSSIPRKDQASRMVRAAALAVRTLQWKLQLAEEPRNAASRTQHLFDVAPVGLFPPSTSNCNVQLAPSGGAIALHQDHWSGWGASAQPECVHVYTDGSHEASSTPHPTSSWAVTVGDEWLDDNFAGVPDEAQLAAQPAHAGGATMLGASILCTRGIYPAELQAIARSLAMFPSSCKLHVHTDSRGALAGITAYEHECNERRRLRMAARPLLQLIHSLIAKREQAGGSYTIEHVKAHSDNTDVHSVGNRLSDFQANRARLRPDRPRPLSLQELPLDRCEHRMCVWQELGRGPMLIDDPRRAALAQLKAQAQARWEARSAIDDQGYIAGPGLRELGRVILPMGWPELDSTFVHVATNSIQFIVDAAGTPASAVVQLSCPHAPCGGSILTLAHLLECQWQPARRFRGRLRHHIVATLTQLAPWTQRWRDANGGLRLRQLLQTLFPVSASASAAERTRHLVRAMCGAFSRAQENTAGRALDCPSAELSRDIFAQMRLRCLERIHRFYDRIRQATAID